ncbi:uncharacterized protein [Ptychodera flava]|uniref:uncharacterized protein n=1 Tax=Ptychodera flava TaxID=63121 RepID=UPI00396A0486
MSLVRAAKHDFENFLAKADFFLSVVLPDEKLSPNTEECRQQVVDAMNSLKHRDSLKIAGEEIQENPGSVEDGTGMGIPHLDDGILTENNNMEEWITRYKYREPISDGTHLSTGIFPGKDRGDLDTDQSTGNNGKLIQAEDNSTQDKVVGAKGNSSTNKEHKGTASVAFSNQAITSHCEEEDTLTDCTSEKSSGKGISESEEASKSLHGDSLCDGSKNSESDCSQRLLNPQGNYPNCPPEVDSKVVTCDSTYSFKDTVKSCEKQNIQEDKGNFQEDQSVLQLTATKNLTAAADEVPPESRKYISVKSLKLSYSDLPKSEDQSQKEKIHPRRNSSGDFEDSESLSGTWSSWSDIDSRRGSSLPRTSFQAFARQISTSSEYSLPETPFPTTLRQNSDFDFDSVLSVRDRSKSLGHVPRFVTIQLQDLTKKRIKVSKMQRRASLSQNLWQVLSENASEDSPLLNSSVSSSDLKKPYHSGWLMNPYDGKRYWCIVADIYCVCLTSLPPQERTKF